MAVEKDSLLLLATGLGVAVTSWAFWKYGSNDALCVFATVGFVCAVADNVKLRRQLREMRAKV
ncbi:hypothetical protein NX784_11075 [Massilia pinisoli]|uniref:Uncharacterized protein n=1 Tax=Massilia pinisoli TaxID=1772194 RepID=A0ABT1ZQF1_9BURK|nr:hypothetical protein [Massilia pinisoli]MCS0582134.1 hypothetical protein [Massilia pinisoli]